jgi:hypothetical protein
LGYTHYFPQARGYSRDEWVGISLAVEKIIAYAAPDVTVCAEYDRPDEPPRIGPDLIAFNGPGDQGCETFWLQRKRAERFQFCKTNYEPYDAIVIACLIAADAIAPGALKISSDGGVDEWQAGLTLASRAIPTLAAEVPEGVRERER